MAEGEDALPLGHSFRMGVDVDGLGVARSETGLRGEICAELHGRAAACAVHADPAAAHTRAGIRAQDDHIRVHTGSGAAGFDAHGVSGTNRRRSVNGVPADEHGDELGINCLFRADRAAGTGKKDRKSEETDGSARDGVNPARPQPRPAPPPPKDQRASARRQGGGTRGAAARRGQPSRSEKGARAAQPTGRARERSGAKSAPGAGRPQRALKAGAKPTRERRQAKQRAAQRRGATGRAGGSDGGKAAAAPHREPRQRGAPTVPAPETRGGNAHPKPAEGGAGWAGRGVWPQANPGAGRRRKGAQRGTEAATDAFRDARGVYRGYFSVLRSSVAP